MYCLGHRREVMPFPENNCQHESIGTDPRTPHPFPHRISVTLSLPSSPLKVQECDGLVSKAHTTPEKRRQFLSLPRPPPSARELPGRHGVRPPGARPRPRPAPGGAWQFREAWPRRLGGLFAVTWFTISFLLINVFFCTKRLFFCEKNTTHTQIF